MLKISLNSILAFYIATFILSCVLGCLLISSKDILLYICCLFIIFLIPPANYYLEVKFNSDLQDDEFSNDETKSDIKEKSEYYIYDNGFSNGFVVCGIYNDKTGTIKFNFRDKEGNLLLDSWYDTLTHFYECGVAVIGYIDPEKQVHYYKIIDKTGHPINLFEYTKVDTFSKDGIAKVTAKDGKINYVDTSGKHLWPEWKEDDTELFNLSYNEKG